VKLSFNEQRELDALPERIAQLEAEQKTIGAQLDDGAIFVKEPAEGTRLTERYAAIDDELLAVLERWEKLEAKRKPQRWTTAGSYRNMATKKSGPAYSEASIKVLKGLEPVKQRPGMYTRTENPLHIVQEVIDNASDEALGGFGAQIVVTLHADGSVSVDDDGRGIPFGLHPDEGVPVVEIVFTQLHAGGKFDKAAGGAYTFSGGLHGVGVSVTNALSQRLDVTVWRDGKIAGIGFAHGDVVRPLTVRAASGRADKKSGTRETFAEGEGASWVVAWSEEGSPVRESYVNLIPTPAGGTHESGLRDGLFQAVKSFVELHSLQPKGVKLLAEDVFARVSFVLSAKVLDPQFQGQIKERLNSRDAVRLVSSFVRPSLELWLNQHVEHGRKLAELVIKQAQARTRAGQKVEKRKSSGVAVLPGKLVDCESTDVLRNELFLRDRLFANNEVHDMAVAIGVDPHAIDDAIDLSNLRYGKICILSDADVDGSHIQVLLLTLFFRHFPQLIERGHVYVARPPLFRVDAPARGKKPAQKLYALDEGELEAILDKLRKDGVRESAWTISRFKGLGEMNAEQLWDTTMNPDTRRLMPVRLGELDFDATVGRMTMLMGKGEAAARRSWLEEK
ncbi:hypothetical protein DFQ30_002547, partial [Apophysomyces sp. BC1015]